MDGDHTIDRCEQVTTRVLSSVFAELRTQQVRFGGIVLKPNMVLAGSACAEQPNVDEVARRTLWTLRGTVPASVPGIAFLSGGQSDTLAAEHLNAMNRRRRRALAADLLLRPWPDRRLASRLGRVR